MNKNAHRGLVTVAVLVLAAIAFIGCGGDSQQELGAFAAIPEDVMLIGSVDLQKMLKIPALADAVNENSGSETAQALRDAGLSPESMQSVLFAVSPPGKKTLAESNMIAVFTSNTELDMDKIMTEAQKDAETNIESSMLAGKKSYSVQRSSDTERELSLMQLSKTMVALGTPAMLESSVHAGESGRTVSANARLMELVPKNSSDMLWLVGTMPANESEGEPPPNPMAPPITAKEIDSYRLDGNYDETSGLKLGYTLRCHESAAAAKLKLWLDSMLPMSAIFLGPNPAEIVQVTAEAEQVRVAITLTPDKLAELQAKAGALKTR